MIYGENYWIRVHDVSEWEPARYTKAGFFICGDEVEWGEKQIAEIGPRIIPPSEAIDNPQEKG